MGVRISDGGALTELVSLPLVDEKSLLRADLGVDDLGAT